MLTYWLSKDCWDAIVKGSIMIGIKTAWNQVKEEIRAKRTMKVRPKDARRSAPRYTRR